MISLTVVFWMYVVLFAFIGGMRGWAKEMLVSFSVILALTFINLLDHYVPYIRDVLPRQSADLFWLRTSIIIILVFFGYQSPNLQRLAPKMTREKLEHTILGVFFGAVNGYLIAGSIWYYMADAKYPFSIITAPDTKTAFGKMALSLLQYLPPHWLGVPGIYFAVVLAFIFVIVVFV